MIRMNDESYFNWRERESREMAAKAKDANARLVHLELAKLYALRLGDKRQVLG